MIGFKADRQVEVGDGLIEAFQAGADPGSLEIRPEIVWIETDRLCAIGDSLLKPVQICVIETGAGPA